MATSFNLAPKGLPAGAPVPSMSGSGLVDPNSDLSLQTPNDYQRSIGITGFTPTGQPIWQTGAQAAYQASQAGGPSAAWGPYGGPPPVVGNATGGPASPMPVYGQAPAPAPASSTGSPASLTSLAPGTQAVGLPAGSSMSGLPAWLVQLQTDLGITPAGTIAQPSGTAPATSAGTAPATRTPGAGGFSPLAARDARMNATAPGSPASASAPGTSAPAGTIPAAGGAVDPSSIAAPSWLQGLVNYGLPIAATLYGGLTEANAFNNAGQTEANAYQSAGNEVANSANNAAAGIESAAGAGAAGILGAGSTAISGTTPYTGAGADAVNRLNNSSFSFNPDMMTADPGYQFRLQQGQEALQAAAAANGGALSGNTLEALTNYNQGFASNEFQNAYNRALQGYLTNMGQQQNLASLGLGATQYAGNTGLTAAEGAGTMGYQGALEGGNFGLSGSTYQGNANSAAGTALGSTGIGAGEANANMANQIAQILMAPPANGGLSLAQLLSKL
ncbi:MAG TPA: hypothetical protein VGR96_15865 [Acidobacteriaceae bacterium]|nr:hypothetical protein [Acidobacteriaceae bacterium]